MRSRAALLALLGFVGIPAARPLRLPTRRDALTYAARASVGIAGLLNMPGEALADTLRLYPDRDPSLGPQDYLKAVAAPEKPLNVIVTGASSGIGRDAAVKMVKRGHVVSVPCRTMEQAERICREITEDAEAFIPGSGVGRAVPFACDLASLASVRKFAAAWQEEGPHRGKSGAGPLHVLALNAGVAPSTDAKSPVRTKDGFEEAVGVNHLAHFLLANLLMPELRGCVPKSNENPPQRRLVVTASQVHDPATPGGNVGPPATLGDLSGLKGGPLFEMADGGSFDGDKAYKDSKLCNVLFVEEAARRLAAATDATTAVSLSPGLITRTGLFRNQKSAFVKAFDFVAYNVARVAETVDFGGDCLLAACIAPELGSAAANGIFYTNSKPGKHTFEAVEVSKEAQEPGKAAALWAISEGLVGLERSKACKEA
uniref:protochlorophyllide reductase n=1 Tax=Phaeomonas parva TaxID=124430 RepID=A0A7S1XMW8_9STRA|mmetsp:Transcript_2132/g.6450  ORF Transcript_2132/g.6450 Transcript_2132/m.6450 type:complete len:428 (+) Transcript_2132:93-1376(+)